MESTASKGGAVSDGGAGPTIWVLVFAGTVTTLMSTLVVPLLGELPTILGTGPSNASWVVTVTLLSGAIATPVTGRLGDMYGSRRILLLCTIPLIMGSFVCAMSSTLGPMLVGRALQGAGFGVVPLGISALRAAVPPERLGSSIAMMSASIGIGGAWDCLSLDHHSDHELANDVLGSGNSEHPGCSSHRVDSPGHSGLRDSRPFRHVRGRGRFHGVGVPSAAGIQGW